MPGPSHDRVTARVVAAPATPVHATLPWWSNVGTASESVAGRTVGRRRAPIRRLDVTLAIRPAGSLADGAASRIWPTTGFGEASR